MSRKTPLYPGSVCSSRSQQYDDYAPLANSEVKNFATDKARRAKAGEELVKLYQPKAGTIESAANAMGVEQQNVPNFRFRTQHAGA